MEIFSPLPNIIESLRCSQKDHFIVCDFSPPRSANPQTLELANSLNPDMFSVSYNPGTSVKMNPVFASFWIQKITNIPSVFTLSTNDLNIQAIEGLLLGAQSLGLNNVVFVMGDLHARAISTTKVLEVTKKMNQGFDINNDKVSHSTSFCIGSTIDISKDWDHEIMLTKRKIDSGSDFFIAQAQFDIAKVVRFLESYRNVTGTHIDIPILWGVQMLAKGSGSFTNIPDNIKFDLENGKPGFDIALDIIDQYFSYGITSFYLLPSFFKTGRRDYLSAGKLISTLT